MSKEYKKLVAEIGHSGHVNDGRNGDINSLSDALKEVYSIVFNCPGIKIKQVAEKRRRSEPTVAKQLAELSEKDFIEYRGAKRTGGYYVKKRLFPQRDSK